MLTYNHYTSEPSIRLRLEFFSSLTACSFNLDVLMINLNNITMAEDPDINGTEDDGKKNIKLINK